MKFLLFWAMYSLRLRQLFPVSYNHLNFSPCGCIKMDMPTSSTSPSRNSWKRLLYAQNKDESNKQACFKYKADLNTQIFPAILPSNVSLAQNPQASLANPSPSTFPALTVPTLQLPPFITTSCPCTSHIPPSTHPPSPSNPHILVNLGLNHAHQRFHERIDDLSPLHICTI